MGGAQVRLRQRGHEDEKERGNVLALRVSPGEEAFPCRHVYTV